MFLTFNFNVNLYEVCLVYNEDSSLSTSQDNSRFRCFSYFVHVFTCFSYGCQHEWTNNSAVRRLRCGWYTFGFGCPSSAAAYCAGIVINIYSLTYVYCLAGWRPSSALPPYTIDILESCYERQCSWNKHLKGTIPILYVGRCHYVKINTVIIAVTSYTSKSRLLHCKYITLYEREFSASKQIENRWHNYIPFNGKAWWIKWYIRVINETSTKLLDLRHLVLLYQWLKMAFSRSSRIKLVNKRRAKDNRQDSPCDNTTIKYK